MKNATMDQDWADNFSFLQTQDSTEAPFLLILQHASSVRHLEEMLGKWLPPHWQLPREELIKMIEHWKKWYQPYRQSSGTSDHIVRSHVDRLCQGQHKTSHYGLQYLYSQKLMENYPWLEMLDIEAENIFWLELDETPGKWGGLHFLFQGKTLRRSGTIGVLISTGQQEVWFLDFSIDHTNLTEELTHSLLKLPGVIHRNYVDQAFIILVGLDGSRLKEYANTETQLTPKQPKNTKVLHIRPEFLPEVQRQLTAMGVPITIVEAQPK